MDAQPKTFTTAKAWALISRFITWALVDKPKPPMLYRMYRYIAITALFVILALLDIWPFNLWPFNSP